MRTLSLESNDQSERLVINGKSSKCRLGEGNVNFIPVYYGLIQKGWKPVSFWDSDVYHGIVKCRFLNDTDVSDLFVIHARFDGSGKEDHSVPCGFFTQEEVTLFKYTVSNELLSVEPATNFRPHHRIPPNPYIRLRDIHNSIPEKYSHINEYLDENRAKYLELCKVHTVATIISQLEEKFF